MHCRDCGAELPSPDLTACRACGRRLAGPLARGDEYGPGLAAGRPLLAVLLLAGLAVLAAATAIVSAAA